MDPSALSERLAESLAAITPPNFSVEERDGMVVISGGGYRAAAEVADIIDGPGGAADNAHEAAWQALSLLQDYVAKAIKRPWPESSSVALPIVRVTETEIRMWFEDAEANKILEAPVLRW